MVALALVVITAVRTTPPPAPAPRALVARAITAMGGEPALRGLQGLTIDFHTATFALGQEETPASPARATVSIGQQSTDYAGNRQAGTIELRNVAGVVNRLRRVTAGRIGMLETNGRPTPDNPGTVANVERGLRRAPERLLLAALDNPAALSALPARAAMLQRAALVLLITLLTPAPLSSQDVAYRVVVHASNPVARLTRDQVSQIFLRRATLWNSRQQVLPVDQTTDSPVRRTFTKKIHRRTVASVQTWWQQQTFAGLGVAPPERPSDLAVLEYIRPF